MTNDLITKYGIYIYIYIYMPYLVIKSFVILFVI